MIHTHTNQSMQIHTNTKYWYVILCIRLNCHVLVCIYLYLYIFDRSLVPNLLSTKFCIRLYWLVCNCKYMYMYMHFSHFKSKLERALSSTMVNLEGPYLFNPHIIDWCTLGSKYTAWYTHIQTNLCTNAKYWYVFI